MNRNLIKERDDTDSQERKGEMVLNYIAENDIHDENDIAWKSDETGNGIELNTLKLEIDDIENEYNEILIESDKKSLCEYQEPQLTRGTTGGVGKRIQASTETILMQPEMRLLIQEKQKEKEKAHFPPSQQPDVKMNERELLMKRFPWMKQSLQSAWDDLEKESHQQGMGKLRSGLNVNHNVTPPSATHNSLLKTRKKQKPPSLLQETDNEYEEKTKIVFNRNIPLLIYDEGKTKCIRLGGDNIPSEKDSLETLYRAVNFNPELKRLTLDLEDLRFPEKEKSIRLALSYISANTLHNPFVISDDMCKLSCKKELMIKAIVAEIERRLLLQRDRREERAEKQKQQNIEIKRQEEEEELRGRDFITSKRLLEESKKVNEDILTNSEKKKERQRRIRLRTKSLPVVERAESKVKQRKKTINPNTCILKDIF